MSAGNPQHDYCFIQSIKEKEKRIESLAWQEPVLKSFNFGTQNSIRIEKKCNESFDMEIVPTQEPSHSTHKQMTVTRQSTGH